MKRVQPSLPQRPATGAMPVRWHAAAAIAVIAAALGAPAAAELQAAPYGAPVRSERVEVSYRDPARLTELGRIPITANESAAWIDSLSKYIATRAERVVPAGQRLVVTINDVKRAGGFEPGRPGRAGEVRIVRDSSPPWIDLSFRLESAQGVLIKEGDRQLRDGNFFYRAGHRGDPLGYEKNLIDAWMRKDFGPPRG